MLGAKDREAERRSYRLQNRVFALQISASGQIISSRERIFDGEPPS